MRPEVDDAEEGEVDRDAVEEGGHDTGRTDHGCRRVVAALGAGFDGALVLRAVWLFAGVARRAVAVGLGAESGVLRCDDHGEGVVEREDHEGEEDSGHEEGVGGRVSLADFEQRDPEEADADCRDAEDCGGEEEEREKEEDDVVDGEDFAREGEEPVDGVEDLGFAE